jgi:7-cyano-7-deazaguanine synthase
MAKNLPPADCVLLASGGMDSTTLAYELAASERVFTPLFIDYGQHCRDTEEAALRAVLPNGSKQRIVAVRLADVYAGSRSRLIEAADLWTTEISADDLYLPYRSLLLLSVGAAYAQAHGCMDLYAAFINSNHAHEIDCTTEFFEKLSAVFEGYGGVRVCLPFRHMTKLEVLTRALELGAPVESTYSCQASPDTPCGACPNCVDRLEAIARLNELTTLGH